MLTINYVNGEPETDVDLESLLGSTVAATVIASAGSVGEEISKGRISLGGTFSADEIIFDLSAVVEDDSTSTEEIQVSQGISIHIDISKIGGYLHTLWVKTYEVLKENPLTVAAVSVVVFLTIVGAIYVAEVITFSTILASLALTFKTMLQTST